METPLCTPNYKIKTILFSYNLPFQFIYMRVEPWANHMTKTKCYFEDHICEHFGNLKTLWELDGTHWELGGKNKKSLIPPSTPILQKKKIGSFLSACFNHSHWLFEISLSQTIHRLFSSRLRLGKYFGDND